MPKQEFDGAVERKLSELQEAAEAEELRYEAAFQEMNQLASSLQERIPEERLVIELDEELTPPSIWFSHRGGDLLAGLKAEGPGLYVFQSYSDFEELDDQYFENEYFIYSDLANAHESLTDKLAGVVARYEFACMQEFSDDDEDD